MKETLHHVPVGVNRIGTKHSNTDEKRTPCAACFAAGGLIGALVMLALIVLAVLA